MDLRMLLTAVWDTFRRVCTKPGSGKNKGIGLEDDQRAAESVRLLRINVVTVEKVDSRVLLCYPTSGQLHKV